MGVEKVRSVGSCLEREGWDGVEVGVEQPETRGREIYKSRECCVLVREASDVHL